MLNSFNNFDIEEKEHLNKLITVSRCVSEPNK